MPRRCCVPYCHSNRQADFEETTFAFPKNEDQKQSWIRAIPGDDLQVTKYSGICIKHFLEPQIIRNDVIKNKDGTTTTKPRYHLKLTPDAVPSIFPKQPKKLSKKAIAMREANKRRSLARAQHAQARREKLLRDDYINNLEDLKSNFKYRLDCRQNWTLVQGPSHIVFMKIDSKETPFVDISVKFFEDFSVVVHVRGVRFPSDKFASVLGENLRCDKWSIFGNFMSHLYSLNDNQKLSSMSRVIDKITGNKVGQNKLESWFINEQLKLAAGEDPQYSPQLMSFVTENPSIYSFMSNSGLFNLPENDNIKKESNS